MLGIGFICFLVGGIILGSAFVCFCGLCLALGYSVCLLGELCWALHLSVFCGGYAGNWVCLFVNISMEKNPL